MGNRKQRWLSTCRFEISTLCNVFIRTSCENGLVDIYHCSWILLVKHFDFLQENVRGCGRRKDFSPQFDSAVWFEPISHHSFSFSKIISVIPTNLKRSSRLRLFPKWEVGREAGNEHSVSIMMHLDLFHLENFLRSCCTQLLHHRQFPQHIIGEHVLVLCLCIICL